ncbi:hypothetical protein C8A00DRAFT_41339 [Chaetomidium leptoderma]|uniref:Methyltransferase n=1 Tax=Chaetomidium leptoderma TaxID=669021 RepID=A0AAN6VRX1_9PEZI|nr:hypothetical protein C8A00DRAFT_41339 [Chaetomidium leptoderma]
MSARTPARLPIPFLDSVGEEDEHGPASKALTRPWMSYWPPQMGSNVHVLLQKTAPEALSWRFNLNRPFDRPWQTWAQAAMSAGKPCVSRVLGPDKASGAVPASETPAPSQQLGASRLQPSRDTDRELGTKGLDAEIAALGLPFVTPQQLNYLSDDGLYDVAKPFHTRLPFLGDIRRSNITGQAYSGIRIHDLSGHEDEFTLDISGFQYLRVPTAVRAWTKDVAESHYLPEMETWLKGFFGAERVHIYTYTFRCDNRERTSSEHWVGPFMRAHCDVSLNSGLRRLDLHFPHDADQIKKGRWRMVGLWRALTGPHQDRPLAVLDNRSVAQDDLIAADVVFPHYCDEGYEVRYNPLHRWFYKQRMTSDDVLMFKHYDSSSDVSRFCPHSAFIDPTVPHDTPQRASIELRAIVID